LLDGGPIDVVTIGSSTGGPNALDVVISGLPIDLSVPIVIVQHMPPVFTTQLAKRLDRNAKLRVVEGEDGMLVEPGVVYIAPGGLHMVVNKSKSDVWIETNEEPPENSCRPAVDPLFRSVAEVYGGSALGVVLTGMGSDGLKGAEDLARVGARIIVQDEPSSVVWGMPGFVSRAGLATVELPLDEIAGAITNAVRVGN
jgi:two-component system chemotaxis response regulator CheB